MSDDKNTNNKSFFKEWLEQLQMESWQLELLISGLALFGIYEAKPMIDEFHHYTRFEVAGETMLTLTSFLDFVFRIGWRIFFVNLLIHVIIRGLWIGTVGLRYVSGEIDYDVLGYSERFTSFLKRRVGPYDDFIERLEYICSVLFAYTFLLFLFFLSFVLFFIWIPLIVIPLERMSSDSTPLNISIFIFVLGYIVLGLIVFIDFITLGAFKKVKDSIISKAYYGIYRFFSTVTLAFLYRPLFYNFIDNKSTRRLFYLSFPYILLLTIGHKFFEFKTRPYFAESSLAQKEHVISPCNYSDLKAKALTQVKNEEVVAIRYCDAPVTLSEFYMDDAYPSIFLKMRQSDKYLFEEAGIESIYRESSLNIFRGIENKSETVKQHNASQDSILKEYREQIRDIRRENKREKEVTTKKFLDAKLDSLIDLRDEVAAEKSSFEKNYKRDRSERIIEILKGMHYITIDGVDYGDSLTCHYYTSPIDQSKGILCHFSSESLPKGQHELRVERTVFTSKSTNNSKREYYLPFIKTK